MNNNITSAFTLYEVLRVLIPGFYTTIILKQIAFSLMIIDTKNSDSGDGWIIFVIVSIVVGGLLYSMDVPRWFKKFYYYLPSNMIERKGLRDKPKDPDPRYSENEYFKFYYALPAGDKFKTDIQSGFFQLFMTMAFINLIFTIVLCFIRGNSPQICEYRILNMLLLIVDAVAALVIYKQLLRHSWKRDFEIYEASKKMSAKDSKSV
jgi:hypothetical protein